VRGVANVNCVCHNFFSECGLGESNSSFLLGRQE